MLTRLPTELARLIYQMYFSLVLKELLERQPQNNDFIVRTTKSGIAVTEVNAHYGILYLTETQTSKLYQNGIQALPLELEHAYCLKLHDIPSGGGYVSPYVRNIVNRVFF
jgi:hypothetical protein